MNNSFQTHHINQALFFYQNRLNQHSSLDEVHLILACIHLDRNNYYSAYSNLNKSIEYQIRRNPYGDHFLADTYTILGSAYDEQNLLQQALQLYQRAFNLYSTIYPSSHAKMLKMRKIINNIYLSKN